MLDQIRADMKFAEDIHQISESLKKISDIASSMIKNTPLSEVKETHIEDSKFIIHDMTSGGFVCGNNICPTSEFADTYGCRDKAVKVAEYILPKDHKFAILEWK